VGLLVLTLLAGVSKSLRAGPKCAQDRLPLPVLVPQRHRAVNMKGKTLKKTAVCCSSSFHKPGVCNGFDAHRHLKSPNQGAWGLAHGSTDIANMLQRKSPEEQRKAALRPLAISTLAATFIMLVEVVSGFHFSSLALLSDGVHQFSDVFLYFGLLVAVKLSEGDACYKSFSYGFGRAQILGAFIALILQYFCSALLVVSAAGSLLSGRSTDESPERGIEVFVVGVFSSLLNALLLLALPESHELGHNHSHAAAHGQAWGVARLHLLGDLIQSGIVILSGILQWWDPSLGWTDAATTLVYVAVMITMSWQVFRDLLWCLMERSPASANSDAMFEDLSKITAVIDVHCFHIWTIGPGQLGMSAHLHIDDDMHEDVLHAAQILLKHKYGIAHSTLQISSDEDIV